MASTKQKPDRLELLGQPFRIEWDWTPDDGAETYGDTHTIERRIRINSEKCGHPEVEERTLLHEVIHGILGSAGYDQMLEDRHEEALVHCLENGLYPVICELVRRGYFRPAAPTKRRRK